MSEELTEELVREVLERVYKDGRPFMDANILAQALRQENRKMEKMITLSKDLATIHEQKVKHLEALVAELEGQLSRAKSVERETVAVDELVTMHEQNVKSLEALVLEKDAALKFLHEQYGPCEGHHEGATSVCVACTVGPALSITPDKARKIREAEERVVEGAIEFKKSGREDLLDAALSALAELRKA